ncbi:ubiquitin domain-containing protein [Rhizophagus clarus]|uniref:Ubiquitin domain-containing protein n=1 Tax=Rhizophagus clarus TaxID=94130 RepID=A0A8H3R1F8_9GLOM|nr:ubiquitin domain-containing protein [Rhizophagus clarus]
MSNLLLVATLSAITKDKVKKKYSWRLVRWALFSFLCRSQSFLNQLFEIWTISYCLRNDRDFTVVNDNRKTLSEEILSINGLVVGKDLLSMFLNNTWLGVDNGRQISTITYHGSEKYNSNTTARGENLSCKKPLPFGYGFYSIPDIDVVSKYAIKFTYEGDDYQVLFQYWISPNAQRE